MMLLVKGEGNRMNQKFLIQLLKTASPSGEEVEIQKKNG